jgi:hypothetical protein
MEIDQIHSKFLKLIKQTKYFIKIKQKYKIILINLYLEKTKLKKYNINRVPLEKEFIDVEWELPFGITIKFNLNIKYKFNYESINIRKNDCERITNFKIQKKNELKFIFQNEEYDDPHSLCCKINGDMKIKTNNKYYDCSKYFNLNEFIFLISYPLIIDENICDDLPIDILKFDISNNF